MALILGGMILIAVGCRITENPNPEEPPVNISASTDAADISFALTSNAFNTGESIPSTYTCDGKDTSPALAWKNAPATTQSFALIVDDPDAPGGTWVH